MRPGIYTHTHREGERRFRPGLAGQGLKKCSGPALGLLKKLKPTHVGLF